MSLAKRRVKGYAQGMAKKAGTALLGTAFLGLAGVLAGCKPGQGVRDAGMVTCPFGDPSLPAEIEIVHRDADGGVERTEGWVPLLQPPQGGKVLLVSVRARNLDGCPLIMTASLRDACSGSVTGLEMRPIQLEPAGDGWGQPRQPMELSNYSNLAVCPAQTAPRRIDGERYALEVRVEDKNGKVAQATIEVTPYCAEAGLLDVCRCECASGRELGAPCTPNQDAAVGSGCPGDGGSSQDGALDASGGPSDAGPSDAGAIDGSRTDA